MFICSRTSPVPGRPAKEGKKFGGNFRNYTHLWDERGYANASKGEKPVIREFLARNHAGPWFAAIADSGQKHVLPFARLNGPGRPGIVLLDELVVRVLPDAYLVVGNGLAPVSIARSPETGAEARTALGRVLAEIVAAHPGQHDVRIVADPTTHYEEIVDVMDVARAAGLTETALADAGTEAAHGS